MSMSPLAIYLCSVQDMEQSRHKQICRLLINGKLDKDSKEFAVHNNRLRCAYGFCMVFKLIAFVLRREWVKPASSREKAISVISKDTGIETVVFFDTQILFTWRFRRFGIVIVWETAKEFLMIFSIVVWNQEPYNTEHRYWA